MKSYGYAARDLAGAQKKGVVQAANSNEVLNQLREQGLTPISVKEVTKKGRQENKAKRSSQTHQICGPCGTLLAVGNNARGRNSYYHSFRHH